MAFIPIFILVLFLLITIDYAAAIQIERGKHKKLFIWMSVISTCLVLFTFKYFNFFNANLTRLAEFIGWNYSASKLSLLLPIGLSFHTFQSLSYVIEVYRGKQKAEHHFGKYALYVMFFPQLVAGPIERPQNLLHQFNKKNSIDYENITSGLKLMAWGFFKKLVIADRLAILVNQVYNNVTEYTGIPLIVATVFFAIQIYCDFSGYSDIAIGSARVLGFKLMINFRQPYFSQSIQEFWQRWHISLSTWFRDYVYIALGGNRVPRWRWYSNILIVFFLSGLWHGANWTFVIWGSLHGFYYLCSAWTQRIRTKVSMCLFGTPFTQLIHQTIQIFITGGMVTFAWIFFRANSLSDAFYIINHLFYGIKLQAKGLKMGLTQSEFTLAILLIIFLFFIEFFQKRYKIIAVLSKQPVVIRWGAYYGLVLSIIVFGKYLGSPFIYFQF